MRRGGGSLSRAASALVVLALVSLASCAGLARPARGAGLAYPRAFWTVRPEAPGRGTLYVQGTLHLGSEELYPLDARTEQAMAASDVVLAELSPEEMEGVEGLVLGRMAASSLGEGVTIAALLPPSDASWAEAFMGVAVFDAVSSYEPWVCSSVIDQFAASRLGLDRGLGVDAALFDLASRLGKRVEGLETAEFQLGLLCGQALGTQTALLRDTIREYREHPDSLLRLYAAYRDDDRAALAREIERSAARSAAFDPGLAGYSDAVLLDRNAAWAERLAGLLDEGRTVYLFAGAAHFVGEGSVLELLEGYGYRSDPR